MSTYKRMGLNDRIDAYRKRDITKYCMFHPHIHKDNEKDIELRTGTVTNKDGTINKFLFCPRCLVTKQKIKERKAS